MRQQEDGAGCAIAVVVSSLCVWTPVLTILFLSRTAENLILLAFAGIAGLLWLAAITRDERERDEHKLTARLMEGLSTVTDAHAAVAGFAGEMMQVVADATQALAQYDETRTMELLGRSADAMARLTEHYPTIQDDA